MSSREDFLEGVALDMLLEEDEGRRGRHGGRKHAGSCRADLSCPALKQQ